MIRIGTRQSTLARAQARLVQQGLQRHGHESTLVPLDTRADATKAIPVHRMGTAGAFTARLEHALATDEIDLAVHSLKDLPLEQPDALTLAALLERGSPQDLLVTRPRAHDPHRSPPLKRHARVATSGPRRQSQLLHARPDLTLLNVRGNVDTRLKKLRDGWFDALVTARVALDRMDLTLPELHATDLDPDRFPPAPGQAAIAVQARQDSPPAHAAATLDHEPTRTATRIERRLLGRHGGGCGLPLGAHAQENGDAWRLTATYAGADWRPHQPPRLARARLDDASPSTLVDDAYHETSNPPTPGKGQPDPDGPLVLIIASRPTATAWATKLERRGHNAHPLPTCTFQHHPPTPQELQTLHDADWILATSKQAAAPLAHALDTLPDAYLAAIGPGTAKALHREGLPCHHIPAQTTGEHLAASIHTLADPHETILLAQGDRPHGTLHDALRDEGRTVHTWTAYTTHETPLDDASLPHPPPAAAALVMSPRNAQRLANARTQLTQRTLAIGPTTAATLRENGHRPHTAPHPTPQAVDDALTDLIETETPP